jgi:hypothetical protein
VTALELFDHLQAQGVRLTPEPDGTLRYKARVGLLTIPLMAVMRQQKTALYDLVVEHEERLALAAGNVRYEADQWQDFGAPAPPVASPPVAPATPVATSTGSEQRLRQWVTGLLPDTAQMALLTPLPAPLYHDTPSPPQTSWGTRCPVKACRRADPAATRSLRFRPSGICVMCWQRWDKRTTSEDSAAGSLDLV